MYEQEHVPPVDAPAPTTQLPCPACGSMLYEDMTCTNKECENHASHVAANE